MLVTMSPSLRAAALIMMLIFSNQALADSNLNYVRNDLDRKLSYCKKDNICRFTRLNAMTSSFAGTRKFNTLLSVAGQEATETIFHIYSCFSGALRAAFWAEDFHVGENGRKHAQKMLPIFVTEGLAKAAEFCNTCPGDDFWESKTGMDLSKNMAPEASKSWQQLTKQCRPNFNAQPPSSDIRRADTTSEPAGLCREATPSCSRRPRNLMSDHRDLRELLHSNDQGLGSENYATFDQVRILNAAGCLPLALKDVGRQFDRNEARSRYQQVLREAIVKVHGVCGRDVSDPDRRQNRQCPSASFWNTEIGRNLLRPTRGVGGSRVSPPQAADGVLEDIKRYCTSRGL